MTRSHEDTLKIIDISMDAASRNNGGGTSVLYVDETMLYDGKYLPIIATAGTAGYAPFVPRIQDAVAAFFGSDYEMANVLVESINADRGISARDAILIVGETMALQNERNGDDDQG